MEPIKQIIIKNIYLKDKILVHELKINEKIFLVKTELSDNVIGFAITDRIDAIVMGLLMFAIRNNYNIISEIPISENLLYNIQNHFINAIIGNSILHKVEINCPTCNNIKEKGRIVSTGISCGVDSLYTIIKHRNKNIPLQYRINHLTFMDIGSHHNCKGTSTSSLFLERKKHIEEYCKEFKIPLIFIKSNLPDIINEIDPLGYSHINYHSFMAIFAILNISSGISRYYYSSGHSYRDFLCKYPEKGQFDSSLFDLLTMNIASYGNTIFSSYGGDCSRIDKVKYISEFPLDASFLDVCIDRSKNCGKCYKCLRTLLEIDAIGKLEVFNKAFRIEEYKKHKDIILIWLYKQYLNGDKFAQELIPYFNFSTLLKSKIIIRNILSKIKNIIKQSF